MSSGEIVGNMANGEVIEKILFSWYDYTLFAFMLGISAAIGIYFGFFGKKQNSIKEYILGGKTMMTFPIAMSLIARIEHLHQGHNHSAGNRLVATTLNFNMASYGAFVFSFYENEDNFISRLFISKKIYKVVRVTHINVHHITPVVCIICIFYTTLGGLKAVVWTDTVQFSVMTVAIIFVMILGFISLGSIGYVFQKSYAGGRLYLWDFDLDPTNRTAVWSPIIGMSFSWTAYVVASQICNQKLQALPTFTNVKWAMVIFVVGVIIVRTISSITGLIIYAKYADCDPVAAQRVDSSDQLLPLYVMEVAGKIPGLPGLFIAGILCAALSTLSTELNTLSGLIYEDFLRPMMPENTSEERASNVMKLVVVILGVFATGMVHVVENLGTVFPLAISLGDITLGPLLGMFSLGMLVPVANSKGTLTGAISALLIVGWISFGSQYHVARGGVITPALPTSVEGCDHVFNSTITNEAEYVPPWFYRISFYYYCLIGIIVTMVVGGIVSVFTGGRDQKVDRNLLSPVIYFLLPEEDNKVDDILMTSIENTADKSVS